MEWRRRDQQVLNPAAFIRLRNEIGITEYTEETKEKFYINSPGVISNLIREICG
jgi:hypothetical protein